MIFSYKCLIVFYALYCDCQFILYLCFQCAIFLIWICESNMNESKCGWVDLLLPLLGRCSLLGRLCYCPERVIKLKSNDQCKVTEQVAFVKRNLNIQLLGFKLEIPQTRSVCLLYYCSTQTSNSLNQTQERRYENKLFKKMLAEYLVKIIWDGCVLFPFFIIINQ